MLYTITGASASGKTTLLKELLKRYPDEITKVVSTTSRAPRNGETDGVDYHFINREEFKRAIEKKEFVEFTEFAGNYYGLRRADIENAIAAKKASIVIVEQHGRKTLRNIYGDKIRCVYIAIDPKKALMRLKNRGGWRKAKERIKADNEDGLYDCSEYDCIIKNDSTKKELAYNFINYAEAVALQKKFHLQNA